MLKRLWIPLAAFFAPALARANVIFPALAAPYAVPFLFPAAILFAMVSEIAIYKVMMKDMDLPKVALLAVAANIASWLAGVGIGILSPERLFPSGLTSSPDGVIMPGKDFIQLALIAFLVAYLLSIAIEGLVLKIASKKWVIRKPFRTALAANTVSYIVLLFIVGSSINAF